MNLFYLTLSPVTFCCYSAMHVDSCVRRRRR